MSKTPGISLGTVHTPEMWIHALMANGWIEVKATVWQAPCGALFRGPYGAWREMLADPELSKAWEQL